MSITKGAILKACDSYWQGMGSLYISSEIISALFGAIIPWLGKKKSFSLKKCVWSLFGVLIGVVVPLMIVFAICLFKAPYSLLKNERVLTKQLTKENTALKTENNKLRNPSTSFSYKNFPLFINDVSIQTDDGNMKNIPLDIFNRNGFPMSIVAHNYTGKDLDDFKIRFVVGDCKVQSSDEGRKNILTRENEGGEYRILSESISRKELVQLESMTLHCTNSGGKNGVEYIISVSAHGMDKSDFHGILLDERQIPRN